MATKKRLIDANSIKYTTHRECAGHGEFYDITTASKKDIDTLPTVDAIEVIHIKAYLLKKLEEWENLGDRRFEPANMWGYNFIMACFDDLNGRNKDA